jgi:hypothetical protein
MSLLAVFDKKMRLEVPLFQRQYVWKREQQWEPLWEDISRKFADDLQGREDAPPHFLGALVLDQKQTPVLQVEKRQVIDGQQRLTTLQIFLAAFRDFCREESFEQLAAECDTVTFNRGMLAEPEVDKFKVWPTQSDRPQFMDVMTAGSRGALLGRYPPVRRRWARAPDPRPPMIDAYLFFYEQLDEFFKGTESDPPIAPELPLTSRLQDAFHVLKNALQVVVIDLERTDDPQVIFETLNARGEPLLPADLLRNFIFLRAARSNEAQEPLYDEYWRRFDEPFWRHEVRQGRLLRPRSDLFMLYFLSSRLTADIPIRHLFAEYKKWIETDHPFSSVREELATLARQGDDFRRIVEPDRRDVLFPVVSFLETFDTRAAYLLLLYLLDVTLADDDLQQIGVTLESYLLRRALCGLQTKSYTRIFLSLIRYLRHDGATANNVRTFFSRQTGDSGLWPTNERLHDPWVRSNIYQQLTKSKIVHVLLRLNATFLTTKNEVIISAQPLTVEHLLPQRWIKNWSLAEGVKGLADIDLMDAPADDARAVATTRRNHLVHTIGNLTILTQPLNSSVSNDAWESKKPALLRSSLLPINQSLDSCGVWNEEEIERHAEDLFRRAIRIWPAPSAIDEAARPQ